MVMPSAASTISRAMRSSHFLDEAAEVAVLHVGLHEDAQPAVLAGDFVRAGVARWIVATWPSGMCLPAGVATSTSPSRSMSSRSLALRGAPESENAARPSIVVVTFFPPRPASTASSTSLRAQAVARHRLAIHFDFEIRLALHARRRDAGRAGHFADDALDLERLRAAARRDRRRESSRRPARECRC